MTENRLVTLPDPAQDVRAELSAQTGIEEPIEKLWFEKLTSAVIDSDRCIQCATCVAVCPSNSIGIAEDDKPTLIRMCTGCSLCWDFCPRSGLRYEKVWKITGGEEAVEGIGLIKGTFTAKAKARNNGAKDGSVITAILEELLLRGEIDGVLAARPTDQAPLQGKAFIARTTDDIRSSAGSFYNQTMALETLVNSRDLPEGARIAVVGTPCQTSGVKAMQQFNWKSWRNRYKVVYTIALMCTRNFHYGKLMYLLRSKGVNLSRLASIKVRNSTLYALNKDGAVLLEANIKDFRSAGLRGCDECSDFLGRSADITVGSVGSADGFSSVLVRTETGKRAWDLANHRLTFRNLDEPEAIAAVDFKNQQRALKSLKRAYDPNLPIWIEYEEHLRAYADSDRAPVKPMTFRIHHYLTSC